MSVLEGSDPRPPASPPGLVPSTIAAGAIVAIGVVAGLVVGGAFRSSSGAEPSPSVSAAVAERSVEPTPVQTLKVREATPKPSPTPVRTPEPSLAIPTPGLADENGIAPPLARIDVPGGDPNVIAALDAAIEHIDRLRSFRFRTNLSGRSLTDLASGGFDLGSDGSLTNVPVRAYDVIVGFRMVEFECSAATSSSSRYVVVGDEAWSQEDGGLEPIPDAASAVGLIGEVAPAGLARRILAPFAAGYERVGADTREGVPAIRYRANGAGRQAYAAVTGIDGDWSADAWIAESGVLLALRIEGHGDGPCDSFLGEISLRDIDDPGIVIARPS